MAWSDAARRAAAEARRRKSNQRVMVTSAHGAKVRVPRDLLAQKIRKARVDLREMRKRYKDMRSHSFEHRNRTARNHGEVWAAAQHRKTQGLRRKQRLDQAYESSIKSGYNAGKRRGGFF